MKQKIIMLMTFLLIGAGFVMAQTQVQGTVVDEQENRLSGPRWCSRATVRKER